MIRTMRWTWWPRVPAIAQPAAAVPLLRLVRLTYSSAPTWSIPIRLVREVVSGCGSALHPMETSPRTSWSRPPAATTRVLRSARPGRGLCRWLPSALRLGLARGTSASFRPRCYFDGIVLTSRSALILATCLGFLVSRSNSFSHTYQRDTRGRRTSSQIRLGRVAAQWAQKASPSRVNPAMFMRISVQCSETGLYSFQGGSNRV